MVYYNYLTKPCSTMFISQKSYSNINGKESIDNRQYMSNGNKLYSNINGNKYLQSINQKHLNFIKSPLIQFKSPFHSHIDIKYNILKKNIIIYILITILCLLIFIAIKLN